ncbi:MAG: sugar phosphate nucleotidyltransferase [Anaerolineales bacterium]|jgi:glucose-1-phosphate adenylyltransferase
MKVRAVILAGGEGSRLGVLTVKRAKPAVPFAGKYRIIDFTLSNCINSHITDVMILAQYRPHSLIEHIGDGGPWDLDRSFTGGVKIYPPFTARRRTDWYRGTADAVRQNLSFVESTRPDLVLILSGDHVYAMDYDPLVSFHRDHGADATICTIRVPIEEASRFGIITTDDQYRVTGFVEKPKRPQGNLVNMGVYLFNMDVLDRMFDEDRSRETSRDDFGKDVLPSMVAEGCRLFAFPYTGYWVDVGTLESYWKAHMDLLEPSPPLDLNNRGWVIHTRSEERPPAMIRSGGVVQDSLVSDGSVIQANARIERSVLSPGVVVGEGARVRESILLTGTVIEPGATVERAVIDKRVRVGAGAQVGERLDSAEGALVSIGKGSEVPAGARIGAGAIIGTEVPADRVPAHLERGKQVWVEKARIE